LPEQECQSSHLVVVSKASSLTASHPSVAASPRLSQSPIRLFSVRCRSIRLRPPSLDSPPSTVATVVETPSIAVSSRLRPLPRRLASIVATASLVHGQSLCNSLCV
ncbi:Unknown protein, partial [Striga hermonthica]